MLPAYASDVRSGDIDRGGLLHVHLRKGRPEVLSASDVVHQIEPPARKIFVRSVSLPLF